MITVHITYDLLINVKSGPITIAKMDERKIYYEIIERFGISLEVATTSMHSGCHTKPSRVGHIMFITNYSLLLWLIAEQREAPANTCHHSVRYAIAGKGKKENN